MRLFAYVILAQRLAKELSAIRRFILSWIRQLNICRQFCRINRILALVGVGEKCDWTAIDLNTLAESVITSFGPSDGSHGGSDPSSRMDRI